MMGLSRAFNIVYRRIQQQTKENTYTNLPTSEKTPNLPLMEKKKENKIKSKHPPSSANPLDRKSVLSITFKTLCGLLIVLWILFQSFTTPFTGTDTPQCRSIYMYPSYAKINGFDEKHTRFSPKYHLYLYREQDTDPLPLVDDKIQLDGIPVLFIPGNAGSFKQARSIAAASAEYFYHNLDKIDNNPENIKNLDFFTADFNEDFTAFHGRTMLDQAEYLNDAIKYIISLYEQSQNTQTKTYGPLPESVIIIGHSMGGVVARVMPTLANYVPHSVNTIITLSSPHSLSPVTFDGDILKVYDVMNKYWIDQFQNDEYYRQNVSVISITGGVLDDVLPSDYTNIEPIVFQNDADTNYKNGFTVYTSTIPGVWTSIDHLAIVWCDQLRQVLSHVLLQIVDKNTPSKTKKLDERMEIFRSNLLSGFEEEAKQDLSILKYRNMKNSKTNDNKLIPVSNTLKLDATENTGSKNYIMELSNAENKESFTFFSTFNDPKAFDILFCKNTLSKPSTKLSKMDCISALSDLNSVPNSRHVQLEHSSILNTHGNVPFSMLTLESQDFSNFTHIIVKTFRTFKEQEVIFAELQIKDTHPIKTSFWSMLFKSVSLVSPKNEWITNFELTSLSSSLFSYKVNVQKSGKLVQSFNPLLKQSIEQPFETKWHILNDPSEVHRINTHNVLPYVPYQKNRDRVLKLQLIKPTNSELKISLNVDWGYTLKLLLLRYRLAFVAFPSFLTALLFAIQIIEYKKTDIFISMGDALEKVLLKYFWHITLVLTILSPLCANFISIYFLQLINPVKLGSLFDSKYFVQNSFYLGIDDIAMCWLGPVFFCITITLVYFAISLVNGIEKFSFKVFEMLNCIDDKEILERKLFSKKQYVFFSIFSCFVAFWIPYQVAFTISFIAQIYICIGLAKFANNDRYTLIRKYNQSILIMFLFVLPINVPTIIVFLHNFAVKWNTPFRSHHNILAIFPITLLVCCNSNGIMFKCRNNSGMKILISTSILMSAFSLVYGVRHSYFIHYLFNLLCCCLLVNSI